MCGKQLLVCAFLLALTHTIAAEYDVNGMCTVVQEGTKLGSIESCQKFYICKSGKAEEQSCPKGQSFDKNSQFCVDSGSVDCYFGNDTPCAGKTQGTHVPWVGTCHGWIYCENGKEMGRGTCTNGMIFNNNQCEYGTCNSNVNGQDSSFNSVCQIMPNNKYFGSTTDCKQWQICRNNKLEGGTCKDVLVYDVNQNKCVYEASNTCKRVTGQSIQPDDEKGGVCSAEEAGDFKGSEQKCGTYYMCQSGQWNRLTCGYNLFWNIDTETCASRQTAVTNTKCDRCQYSNKQFVNAMDPNCQTYFICEGGVAKGKGVCKGDTQYFDEKSQACVSNADGKANYAKSHAACTVQSPPQPGGPPETPSGPSEPETPSGPSEPETEGEPPKKENPKGDTKEDPGKKNDACEGEACDGEE